MHTNDTKYYMTPFFLYIKPTDFNRMCLKNNTATTERITRVDCVSVCVDLLVC